MAQQQFTEQFRKDHEEIHDILFKEINGKFGYDLDVDFDERDGHNLSHVNVDAALGRTLNRGDVITNLDELNKLKAYFENFFKVLQNTPPRWLTRARVVELEGFLTQGQALVQSQINEVQGLQLSSRKDAKQPSIPRPTFYSYSAALEPRPSFWTPTKKTILISGIPMGFFSLLVGIEASLTMAGKSATSLLEGAGNFNILIATLAFVVSLAPPVGVCVVKRQENCRASML